jgi:hypothetical protein
LLVEEGKCALCGSERMIPNVKVLDQGQYSGGRLLLRACPKLTSHFPIRAKVSLSPSKGNFCGLGIENPLEIALRHAQGDLSLVTKIQSCFWTTP